MPILHRKQPTTLPFEPLWARRPWKVFFDEAGHFVSPKE